MVVADVLECVGDAVDQVLLADGRHGGAKCYTLAVVPGAGVSWAPTNNKRSSPVSAYKIIELVGTSAKSWEDAAQQAVASASKSLRNLRVAEVTQQRSEEHRY